jgi:hypothetical protein
LHHFHRTESWLEKDLLWTGSDDGIISVSKDGGQHWENVTPKDAPKLDDVELRRTLIHLKKAKLTLWARDTKAMIFSSVYLQDGRLWQVMEADYKWH